MNGRQEFAMWAMLCIGAVALLGGTLAWQSRSIGARTSSIVPPRPKEGSIVFREKGCAACHGPGGVGSQSAPALRGKDSLSTLPRLVTAMWNHAPRMWEAMDSQKLTYPELSYEEMGELVSYLYFSRYADDNGDSDRGRVVFQEKNCIRCHAMHGTGGHRGPDLGSVQSVETPILWTQVLWNHASKMQKQMAGMGMKWPHFEEQDMADLFAYVRRENGHSDGEFPFPASDPQNGWQVFQAKACIKCHSVTADSPSPAPTLGPNRPLPSSFSEFGAMMLNHFPNMQESMNGMGQPVPVFEAGEMSDLVGFIYSLRYTEPSGSAPIGQSVFQWRGCTQCHGPQAEGTRAGPALRGRGQNYTANRLATDLWRHGARMHEQGTRMNHSWPTLNEGDVGNLLTFLNSPIEQ